MRMIRKQVYITDGHDAKLKRLAAAKGVTEAEVIRAALDGVVEVTYQPGSEARTGRYIREVAVEERKMTEEREQDMNGRGTLGRRVLDREAWRQELAFIQGLATGQREDGTVTKWRREDAYDQRRLRLPN